MYAIEWASRALKQLKRLPRADQARIVAAVRELRGWPDCRNVLRLSGRDGYRLRVGRYRVLFDAQDRLRIIWVEEVKKRDEHTY